MNETQSKTMDLFLPIEGEGLTRASQAVTAVYKLNYKGENDGDVYDNRFSFDGGENDISSYANGLYSNVEETREVLNKIKTSTKYQEILDELNKICLSEGFLRAMNQVEKTGTIYDCDGPYKFEKKGENKMDNEKRIKEKGIKAAKLFLENKGYEIVDESYKCNYGQVNLVAKFEDALVFVEVTTTKNTDDMPQEKLDRHGCEQIMIKYIKEHDYVDMPIRGDSLSICVIDDGRALIKHHVNALGEA